MDIRGKCHFKRKDKTMNREKIIVMLAEGFEEVEALTVVDLLRRAQLPVYTASVTGRRQVDGAHGVAIIADKVFEDIDFDEVRMIVLPGGMPGTTNLLNYEPLTVVLKQFAAEDRPLGAICAAPMIFAAHGILCGKRATIYAGMEAELKDAIWTEGNVVKEGNIITSKGPGTAMDFALALIAFLAGEAKAEEVRTGLLYQK